MRKCLMRVCVHGRMRRWCKWEFLCMFTLLIRHGIRGSPTIARIQIFFLAFRSQLFGSFYFFNFLCIQKILQRVVRYIPLLSDSSTDNFSILTKSRDIITSQAHLLSRATRGNKLYTFKKNFLSHCDVFVYTTYQIFY